MSPELCWWVRYVIYGEAGRYVDYVEGWGRDENGDNEVDNNGGGGSSDDLLSIWGLDISV